MESKRVVNFLIVVVVLAVIVLLAVLIFVDFDAIKDRKLKEFTVKYEATVGGKVEGNTVQIIQEGKSSETVKAVPNEGYRFLKWSDTCNPDPVRTDVDVTGNISSKAVFLKISDIEYKIFLVYITEVQATFTTLDGVEVVADHRLDEQELQLCHMITQQFDIYLNEMFDGLVNFVIDEYYTREIVREDSFSGILQSMMDLSAFAENIPEVVGMLDEYDCYLTSSYLSDPNHLLNFSGGAADYKTGSIHLNVHWNGSSFIVGSLDKRTALLEGGSSKNGFNTEDWRSLIEVYLHEFTHTVEQGLFQNRYLYPYHNVLAAYDKLEGAYKLNNLGRTKLYLLNQAIYEGHTVGIPFPVWSNEVYTVNYGVDDMTKGTIEGDMLRYGYPWGQNLRVAKGYGIGEVKAIPYNGYKFVCWSDGVTTEVRYDLNVQKDMNIIAIFKAVDE